MKLKKLIALILSLAFAIALVSCVKPAKSEESKEDSENLGSETNLEPEEVSPDDEGPITGGWTPAESPEITDEIRAMVEKAASGFVGAAYIPVAYLASQVVAGYNHAILCRVSPASPNPVETYAIVYIYEDLEGGAQITDVNDSGVPTNIPPDKTLSGGWAQAESPAVTDEAMAVFDKALEGIVGMSYTTVAMLATQVVAGMNYCFLCNANGTYPDADSNYVLVKVYEDIEGNANVTSIEEFPSEEVGDEPVQIANPIVEYDSVESAAESAGFSLTAPESIDGYSEKSVQLISGKLFQILFSNGDSRVIIRKALGSDNISGDYNSYVETWVIAVDELRVTMKGNDRLISVATWTDGGYTYSVTLDEPMSISAVSAIVSEVK